MQYSYITDMFYYCTKICRYRYFNTNLDYISYLQNIYIWIYYGMRHTILDNHIFMTIQNLKTNHLINLPRRWIHFTIKMYIASFSDEIAILNLYVLLGVNELVIILADGSMFGCVIYLVNFQGTKFLSNIKNIMM